MIINHFLHLCNTTKADCYLFSWRIKNINVNDMRIYSTRDRAKCNVRLLVSPEIGYRMIIGITTGRDYYYMRNSVTNTNHQL